MSVDAFTAFAPYWDLFETTGLNARITDYVDAPRSSVLVLGSGQGLVPRTLLDAGYAVTSVDLSTEMAAYAWQRRQVPTLVADATTVTIGQRFQTVVVSTGLITEDSVDGPFMGRLLDNIVRHLERDGTVLVGYLRASRVSDAKRLLGLDGSRAAIAALWLSRGSLAEIERAYVEHGYEPQLVAHLFRKYHAPLDEWRAFIGELGERYMERHGELPSESFVNEVMRFSSQYLRPPYEASLVATLQQVLRIERQVTVEHETQVVVCKRRTEDE